MVPHQLLVPAALGAGVLFGLQWRRVGKRGYRHCQQSSALAINEDHSTFQQVVKVNFQLYSEYGLIQCCKVASRHHNRTDCSFT